jgi:hypothetical protein
MAEHKYAVVTILRLDDAGRLLWLETRRMEYTFDAAQNTLTAWANKVWGEGEWELRRTGSVWPVEAVKGDERILLR